MRSQFGEEIICCGIFEGFFGYFENFGGEVYKACRTSDRSIFCRQHGVFDQTVLGEMGCMAANPPLRDLINWGSWIGVSPEFPVFYA